MSSEHVVPISSEGERIDVLLRNLEPDHSRTAIKKLIDAGSVLVNNKPVAPSYRARPEDVISYTLSDAQTVLPAENIPLVILYEDEHIIVVNKPPGITVHPVRAGHTGTLVNALLAYTDILSDCGGDLRRGIVHRLDRDTSGVMVTARTNESHAALSAQFKKREVRKSYTALVEGRIELDADRVSMKVERHARRPQRMAASDSGRKADTDYEVQERFERYTLVLARPRTGRTHQIRLAFSEIGHPIVCDSAYGARKILEIAGRTVMNRQALHSTSLSLTHPMTEETMEFSAPLPSDITEALMFLREESGKMKGVQGR